MLSTSCCPPISNDRDGTSRILEKSAKLLARDFAHEKKDQTLKKCGESSDFFGNNIRIPFRPLTPTSDDVRPDSGCLVRKPERKSWK